MYNKRLAITEADYKRLESLFERFLNVETFESPFREYMIKAKSYSKTRILFDFWHYLNRYNETLASITKNKSDYEFLRGLYNYLNDTTLESALNAILYDPQGVAYIG